VGTCPRGAGFVEVGLKRDDGSRVHSRTGRDGGNLWYDSCLAFAELLEGERATQLSAVAAAHSSHVPGSVTLDRPWCRRDSMMMSSDRGGARVVAAGGPRRGRSRSAGRMAHGPHIRAGCKHNGQEGDKQRAHKHRWIVGLRELDAKWDGSVTSISNGAFRGVPGAAPVGPELLRDATKPPHRSSKR